MSESDKLTFSYQVTQGSSMHDGRKTPEISQHAEQEIARPRVGVLLVHGLNGSRRDMEDIAELVTQRGMIAENMLLPGHGTHVDDMLPLGWFDWSRALRRELRKLKQTCDLVFLVGHSLGGALCLHTAAYEEVAGIVTMCAPLHMFFLTKPMVRLARRFTPVLPTIREDVRDAVARRGYTRGNYRWTPMAPVESMLDYLPHLRRELPRVTAPALIIRATHDHVVPARDGMAIYHALGSQEKELVTLRRSYHVVTKDYEREEVFAHVLGFIERQVDRYAQNE
jgi:carboxylesterase